MSIEANGAPELEEFYDSYCPRRIPTAKTKRAKQNFAKKYRMPVIRVGNSALINPRAGDARLAELALYQDDRGPRRGRPRAA